jgi:hypothetical protein
MENLFGSQLSCFKRDPSCHIETPTSLFNEEVFKQRWYQERTTYHAWEVPQRVPSSVSSRILRSDVASWAWTSRTPKIHCTSRQLGMTAAQRFTSLGTDFEMHAIWQVYVEEPAAKVFVAGRPTLSNWPKHKESTGTWSSAMTAWESSRSCHRTSDNQSLSTNLEIPWGFLTWALLRYLVGAYVTLESESWRIFVSKEGMIHNSPNRRLHEKPLAKGGIGGKIR